MSLCDCEIFLNHRCVDCGCGEDVDDCILLEECGICCEMLPNIRHNICLDCLCIDHHRNAEQNPYKPHLHPYTQMPTRDCSLCKIK